MSLRDIAAKRLIFARLFEQYLLDQLSVVLQDRHLFLELLGVFFFVFLERKHSLSPLRRREFLVQLDLLFHRLLQLEFVLQFLEVSLRREGLSVQRPRKQSSFVLYCLLAL